jgi:hypothetical protein
MKVLVPALGGNVVLEQIREIGEWRWPITPPGKTQAAVVAQFGALYGSLEVTV